MKILALDASTTTIGVSVLSQDGYGTITLDEVYFYKPPKDGHLFERFKIVKEFVISLIDKYTPDEIVIEDFIAYMQKSNSATIILLATFNRMIGMAVYEKTGKPPKMINVVALRHVLKITPDLPPKEDIPELVAHHLCIPFPYEYKVYKRKMKLPPKIADESFDMADAIALGLGYLMKPDLAIQKPKVKKKKTKVVAAAKKKVKPVAAKKKKKKVKAKKI